MTLSARGSALAVFLLEDRSSQQRRHESMYVQIFHGFCCGNLFVCFVLGGFQPSVVGADVTVLEVVR